MLRFSFQQTLGLMIFSVFFAACSERAEHVNLEDRLVPVDSGESLSGVETENVVNEDSAVVSDDKKDPASTALMNLREKILMNSDIPERALDNAFEYYNKNHTIIRNKNYITVFDIGQHSGRRRLYLIDLATGDVKAMHVAHGSGSDRNDDGIATDFSNVNGSHQSSLGFILTAETYYGKHGESLRLDGQESRNSLVRPRAIVIHSASYVSPSLSKMGRSQGCPAVSLGNIKDFIAKIKNGSLLYIYHKDHDGK